MTALALGCSHTAGVGVAQADNYVSQLAQQLNHTVINNGVPGGNHAQVQMNLVRALKTTPQLDFVIAQWPNPFRRTTYYNTKPRNETVHNSGLAFQELLRASEMNFVEPWIQAIITCDLLCKTAGVPVIHIMIENVSDQIHARLTAEQITLHVDRKTPAETWLMDSAASDNLHHSAVCHKQWAQRLLGLINEYTT